MWVPAQKAEQTSGSPKAQRSSETEPHVVTDRRTRASGPEGTAAPLHSGHVSVHGAFLFQTSQGSPGTFHTKDYPGFMKGTKTSLCQAHFLTLLQSNSPTSKPTLCTEATQGELS